MRQLPFCLALLCFITTSSQVTVGFETLINGQGDFNDQFLDILQDGSGNTYTVGSTMTSGEDRNILLVKWNDQGQQQWIWTYSGSGQGPDEGKKIKLLPDGRLAIAGYVNSKSVGNDFFIAVLNSAGDTSWTRTFNDPTTNLYDEVNDLEIDASGNIYITGDSDNDPTAFTNNDMLTVKYSAAGDLLWSARYNATANNNDRSLGIALGLNNDVYIAGRTFNGANDDFILIKYNTAGTQQWIRTYNNGGTDRAVGVVTDNNGLIYIAGRSDNGNDDDYRVLQYNSAGTIQWNTIYNNAGDDRPTAIEAIPGGGCVITGKSDGNPTALLDYNIVTVKFAATGAQLWVKTYAGNAASEDFPTCISRNINGDIAVGGNTGLNSIYNGISLLYNDSGTLLISQIYNGGALNDELNGIVATGNGALKSVGFRGLATNNREAVVLNYTSNAAPLIATFGGQGDNTDNIRAIASGSNGNLYFCGYTVYPDSSRDFWVGALNSTGTQLWSYRTSGTLFGSDEEANAITLDAANNVYVSGYLKNAGTSSDQFIAKFNATGAMQWNRIIDGIQHESDRVYDIAIDATGNIYVTGKSDTDVSWMVNDEITTVKISNAGVIQWTQTFTGIGMGSDRGVLIRAGTNAVYVAAKRVNTTDDIVLLKYSTAGVLQWNYTLPLDAGNDAVNDMWLDAAGNIYLAGEAERMAGSSDIDGFIASISATGTENWVRYIGSQGVNTERTVSGLIQSNQLHIVSNIDGNSSAIQNTDIRYSVYDTQGNLISETDYATDMEEVASRIFLHTGGAAFVIGNTYQASASDLDIKIGYNSFSNDVATLAYSRNTSDSIDFFATGQLNANTLYTGGSSFTTVGKRDAFLGKYLVASPTPGCMDPTACNYNSLATVNDNSCIYPSTVPTFTAPNVYCSGATIPALPTTSNNGIIGSWSTPINNTTTTTYTFTPNQGQCAVSTTLTVTITPNTTPTFSAVGPYCSGASIPALPTTSNNGINGTWSSAINNTTTTQYTFTPNSGQCAVSTTLTIVITPNVAPTFSSVGPYCIGASIPALPTTSSNGISGTWSSPINNTATANYTFTPTAGQCATSTTLTITITQETTPTFSAVGPYCNGANIPALPNTSVNGINGNWSSPINNTATTNYTFTPNAGQCATSTTLTIAITPNTTPIFETVGPYCEGATIAALPTTSVNGITGNWMPEIDNTTTTLYNFIPTTGQCAAATSTTISIAPSPFAGNDVIVSTCSGASEFSLFGYLGVNIDTTGIWSGPTSLGFGYMGELTPDIQSSGTYYYIVPSNGICPSDSSIVTVGITDNNNAQIVYPPSVCGVSSEYAAPYLTGTAGGVFTCSDNALVIDPNSGIISVLNSAPGNYIIQYALQQTGGCNAFETQTTIQIENIVLPVFAGLEQTVYCMGDSVPSLPNISDNGVQGMWSPPINDTITAQYLFQPTSGCASDVTIILQIQEVILPVFEFATTYCLGDNIPELPTTSNNGISGSWTPELNAMATTEYTFLPNSSGCAESLVTIIEIQPSGCTDALACNFNSNAICDDGTCAYSSCSDSLACNFYPALACSDSSCTYPGCTDSQACNYDPAAACDNLSCSYPGCADSTACNFDPTAICAGSLCLFPGCTDSSAINFDAQAICNGVCYYAGCTDSLACNFDATAWTSDSTCIYPLTYYDCYGNCLNDSDGNLICDELEITGCTDSAACNYEANATTTDNSCTYPGCTFDIACNYDPGAGCDDGSCAWPGCTDILACNYSADVICSSGLCYYPGCSSPDACNYDTTAGCDDGSCLFPGCMNPDACNFDPTAPCENNSCIIAGCIIPAACNYDPSAGCNNLSCNLVGGGMLFNDNFENYNSIFGITQQSVNWQLWQTTSNDALSSNLAASGGNQSMLIDGINNHLLLRTEDYNDGIIDISFDLSVLNNGASISLLRTYTSPTDVERGLTLVIDGDNLLNVISGDTSLLNGAAISAWNQMNIHIDLHYDSAWLSMNGDTLAQWPWSAFDITGLPGNNAFAGMEVRGMNTDGNDAQFLMDEISLEYSDFHDCSENCIHDINANGICDEYETPTTQITELAESIFTVYPNPTNGLLSISKNHSLITSDIVVRDITGKSLLKQQNVQTIDLSEFAGGTYFIEIKNGHGQQVIKVTKE